MTLEELGEEEEFYGQFPGDHAREPDCYGPYCVPANDGTTRVICPSDCTLCGINGDSMDDDWNMNE